MIIIKKILNLFFILFIFMLPIEADEILVGVGRVPNVEGLNLEAAGVEYDRRNGIKVNDFLQTSCRNIYAAGDVNGVVREAAAGPMQTVVEYSEEPLVSSDIIGNPHSSIFDALSTASMQDGFVRIVSWYDNEWGYSNRVVDLIDRMAKL